MIQRSIAYVVFECLECNSLMIGTPASKGTPIACERCGVLAGVTITQEERMQMERAQQQQHKRQGPRMQTFNVRF